MLVSRKNTRKSIAYIFWTAGCAVATMLIFNGEENFFASLLLLISFLIGSAFYSHLIAARSFRPLTFSASLFYVYGFIMPGLYVARTGNFYWPSNALSQDSIAFAAVLVLFSTLALVLGNFTSIRIKRTAFETASHVLEGRQRRLRYRESRSVLIVALFVAAYIGFVIVSYGLPIFIGTRESTGLYANMIGLNSTSYGLVKSASQGLSVGLFALTSYVFFQLGAKGWYILLALFISIIMLLLVNNPLFVPRFWIVATFVTVALTTFSYSFMKWRAVIFAVVPVLMFLVFPALGEFNRRGDGLSFAFETVSPAEFMSHGDLDGFQSMTNIVNLQMIEGFSCGGRLLSALLFFVPRSIWSGKFISTGSDAAESAGYTFTRISMPLPGELYIDGGVVFMVLGMFLVGVAMRRLDQIYVNAQRSSATCANVVAPLICIILSGFAPIIFRGSLLSVISGASVAISVVLIWRAMSIISLKAAPPTRVERQ